MIDYSLSMIRGDGLKERGFTFIETLAVIIIISIITAAVVPRFFSSQAGGSLAADVVASDIIFTQLEAMNKNRPLTVSVTTPFTYSYGDGLSRDLRSMNPSISISAAQSVTFNSLGEPVGMSNPAAFIVNDGSGTVSVMIEPFTGKLSRQ